MIARPDSIERDFVRGEHRYELLTWPEINEAVAQEKVVVLPIGSVEQHGHHLPLDVDVKLASSVCNAAGVRAPETMLVLPAVGYGFTHHVMWAALWDFMQDFQKRGIAAWEDFAASRKDRPFPRPEAGADGEGAEKQRELEERYLPPQMLGKYRRK